jgi:radical SAM-linked protein
MTQRFRITYARTEALRYIGNLDMQKVWERYVRRLKVPIAYSQGFHPQAKIQQACPLPLGFLSTCEITDIWVDDDLATPESIFAALTVIPQPGIDIQEIQNVALHSPSLMTLVTHARYTAWLFDPIEPQVLQHEIERVLQAESLIRERRRKSYDLRKLIESLTLISQDGQNTLDMLLLAQASATGRPEAVLTELGLDSYAARYTRTELHVKPVTEQLAA